MTETEVHAALTVAIRAAAPGATLYLPNQPGPEAPQPPFVGVQIVPLTRTSPAIAGGHVIGRGRIVLTIASPEGGGHGEGNAVAETYAAAFPKARKITAGDGMITIIDAPQVRDGTAVSGRWEQPVIIDYLTT